VQSPGNGPWLERWLSAPRLERYLLAAANDRERALSLYDWNARISAAVLRDVAHLEVGLRNAYDEALSATSAADQLRWTSASMTAFPPVHRTKRAPDGSTHQVDINRKAREILDAAIRAAGGPQAPSGKVVANLTFGFWRYLSSKAHEKSLWVPYLHTVFPPKTSRREVDARIGRLHDLRNRAAHHEPLIDTDLVARLDDLLWIAERLEPTLAQFIRSSTDVTGLDSCRP
jgi:hypothetical protein